ncbi:enoyl-CoA hydratase/isomerase family protein [Frankia sp. CNm7]|uniref:Enoyl-CoA hydratase/isomerase family protein n=1 Tax=Frankia nepalensis TaxID=1836974 RepID=A0A937RLV6_9ACTN|nr:enoyl-CoA hydratase/isomerase family protein [Frankia nepalensis]MBL7501091.1 enoyl-CoA hydratase/isomerase family protein [Frankia nepalensis]MBL7512956.1 enoyl-CoA hydratase/isomerase family protein [Frankia nepalensis]MBL7519872.1 enoyl-CoA hydratase/isomerase family protein [Frankia nepalensis]MBL7631285.1 enoyl-CoA hydratase/isomerase family protein [Frankia nepalensis]
MADGQPENSQDPGDPVLIEARGAVRVVTLNRPASLNATDEELHGALERTWRELAADQEARAVVLTGAGRAFSAGGDLGLLDRMVGDTALRAAIMAEAAEIVRGMTSLRVPIVSAVAGPAVGLGCSLAAMSDLVIVEEHAYFADPHVALGLVAADGGALTWPLLMSLLRAKEFILLGDRLPAEEAFRLGLANRVVGRGEALPVALGLAERLAALPPQAVAETKALLNSALRAGVDTLLAAAMDREAASFDEPAFQNNLARMLRRAGSA